MGIRTLVERLRPLWPHALTILGPDLTTGYEVTGQPDGSVNVNTIGAGILDEYTIGAADIEFSAAAPALTVLVLGGSGKLSYTTPGGIVCTVGDGAYPLASASAALDLRAVTIHGTAHATPSDALTIRVRS